MTMIDERESDKKQEDGGAENIATEQRSEI